MNKGTNSKKILKVAIILSIIAMILIISLIILINISKNKTEGDVTNKEYDSEGYDEEPIKYTVKRTTVTINYYTMYLLSSRFIGNYIDSQKEELYNVLNPEYTEKYEITKENVIEKLTQYCNYNAEARNVIINDMYEVNLSTRVTAYFIYGYIVNTSHSIKIPFELMIEADIVGDNFYIVPGNYLKEKGYENLNEGQKIEIILEEVKNNDYNIFRYSTISKENLSKMYFDKIRQTLVYDSNEEAFELLDSEYKEKKFDNNIENFKIYLKEHLLSIFTAKLKEYKIYNYEGYNEYIFIDQNQRYYVVKELTVGKISVLLDTYTVNLPEFIEEYNKAIDVKKVGYNIERFVQAINANDYSYVYSHLDDTFKANNFETEDLFKVYMKETFIDNIVVESVSSKHEGNIFAYKVTLKDNNNEFSKMNLTVIMQLKQETDYVMSFSVE